MPITARDVTLARLAAGAYADNEVAAQQPPGFALVSAEALGFVPSGGATFEGGLYRNGNSAAVVTEGVVAGQPSLVLAFRGSDDREDSINDLRGINADYADFAPLIAAVDAAIASGRYASLAVTGHSLGGAMAQLYAVNHPDGAFRATTFGSPGAQIPEGEDPRVTNVVIAEDPAVWLGENRATAGDRLQSNPLEAGAAIFVSSIVFPGLTVQDAVDSIGTLDTDYENRGATVTLPGLDGRPDPITSFEGVLAADPRAHDPNLYVTKAAAALAVNQGEAPESVIVWRNEASGAPALWRLEGTAVADARELPPTPAEWTLEGAGDANGDASTDLFFRASDGSLVVWQTTALALGPTGVIGNPGADWRLGGIGDTDGDARSDLFLQRPDTTVELWQLSGLTVLARTEVARPGGEWAIAGVGDFDGDGRADLVWEGSGDRRAIWQMEGGTMRDSAEFGDRTGPDWSIAGTGDFDGDGKSDLLWQRTDGMVAAWLMDGFTVRDTAEIANPGTNWRIAAVQEIDADGRDEILWHDADGSVAAWNLEGLSLGTTAVFATQGTEWTAVA